NCLEAARSMADSTRANPAADAARANPATREDQAELFSLAETLSSLIALIRDEKLVYVNPAGCALLGHPREYFVGRHFSEVVHPDDRDKALSRARARAAGHAPKRVTERLLHADGHAIWMEYSINAIQFQGQRTTLVTGNDVTDRLRMEEELR